MSPLDTLPFVCIIGAGPSGLAAAKALQDRGIPFDCFEKRDRVGGLWAFGKDGGSAAYRSLIINTSRRRTQFADFPMPDHYPDFPHHTQMAAYFNAYTDRFGLRDRITFNTEVRRAELTPDGLWAITLSSGETRLYDALIVANGHHWDPRWPEPPFPGEFHGRVMHAREYVDNSDLVGKNVVVVGIGNSAADIAVESSFVANKTFLSMRRGALVVPKYLLGRPFDQLPQPVGMPWPVKRLVLNLVYRILVGRVERYGMPRPDHAFGEAHPTVSDYLLARVAHGFITPKPTIAALLGDRVQFADGSVEPVDVIIYCTGYKVTFPFFDPAFISAPDNELPLFKRVFRPGIPNLAFIGLLQPLGSIIPLAEAQAKWVAAYLAGEYALPSRAQMEADMERQRRAIARRYVRSPRHTMQVDFDEYLLALRWERWQGALRARRQGNRLPVPARARAGSGAAATARGAGG